ncbi:hypothetical protein [Dactylosporangium darangshiense]|uniref:hypothetical protein n=1 Tax=Dactylosporangium darangshiense TaxID=579108 RepID=UPI0036411D5E
MSVVIGTSWRNRRGYVSPRIGRLLAMLDPQRLPGWLLHCCHRVGDAGDRLLSQRPIADIRTRQ